MRAMPVLLAWLLGLLVAELLGMGTAHVVQMHGLGTELTITLADTMIVSARLLFLALIAQRIGLGLSYAVYRPPPRRRLWAVPLLALATAALDYIVATRAGSEPYVPQLMDYEYYASQGIRWAFPLRVAYYISEITALNYIYILANKTWTKPSPPLTPGLLFLLLTWALPHALTKDPLVALYAGALILMLYTGYEQTRAPLTPLLLWLTVLTI